jgi:hypothetical protein
MIAETELRLGNFILFKVAARIAPVRCTYHHFELLSKGGAKDMFPVVLKAEVLERCGFAENKDYPLLPGAREFKLVLPVIGNGINEIAGYVKSNGECFARAVVNGTPASNNLVHLHAVQNLYAALTGSELNVAL